MERVQSHHYLSDFQELGYSPAFPYHILRTMSPREERVLRLRFGLFGEEKPLSLKEVAAIFGTSTAKISRIEHVAIHKFFEFFKSTGERGRPASD